MLRISPTHLGLDGGPGAFPKTGQVAGNLNRSMSRRQEMQDKWRLAVGDAGMHGETEEFLHADCENRPFLAAIIDGD